MTMLEDIVNEVLVDEGSRKNDTLFLLNVWRKQGARAYFNYQDLLVVDEPMKLLEMKKEVMKGLSSAPKEEKAEGEPKNDKKATSKAKKKGKTDSIMPVGSDIVVD